MKLNLGMHILFIYMLKLMCASEVQKSKYEQVRREFVLSESTYMRSIVGWICVKLLHL